MKTLKEKEFVEAWANKLSFFQSLNIRSDNTGDSIQRYYQYSNWLYRRFHSREGAMHAPIQINEAERHCEKLRYQAHGVSELIEKHKYRKVLELGCGMGYNLNYLARVHQACDFTGIDLTPENLKIAQKRAAKIGNVSYHQADFNQLEFNEKYDLIFAIETLCYARDINDVVQNAMDHLRPGGTLIIFDGFENMPVSALSHTEQKCYKLLCWGYEVINFHNIHLITDRVRLTEMMDLTENIKPNLKTFQQSSQSALQHLWLWKFLAQLRLIPLPYIKQTIAGLLSYYFLENGFITYRKLVIRK